MKNTQGAYGVPHAESPPRSEIRLRGTNGGGSTNTKVFRWEVPSKRVGTSIAFVQSDVLGDMFRILEGGVYAISVTVPVQSTSGYVAIMVNCTQNATAIGSITDGSLRAAAVDTGGNTIAFCSWVGNLSVNDLVSINADSTSNSNQPPVQTVTITRLTS